MTVADFSLGSHTFLNSEETLAWPVPGLQTADVRARHLLPQLLTLLWQLPSTPSAAYAAAAGVGFGSSTSLALKNVHVQLSFCQIANFLPEEKDKMAEAEL